MHRGWVLFGLAAACGGDFHSAAVARPSSAAAQPAASARAAWYYHPASAPLLLVRHDLDAQRALYLGQYGDRWLADLAQRRVEVARDMAPAALVAVAQRSEHDWSFVAADGSVFHSASALGEFQRTTTPPTPMIEVGAQREALLGIARGGQLWRSTDLGDSWKAAGPSGSRFADVAFATDGGALAVAVPEQHWLSVDQGDTWTQSASAPFGMLSLVSRGGAVQAQGVLGRFGWQRSGASSAFVHDSTPPVKIELPFALPRGPSAAALLSQRAVIVGNQYFELESHKQTGPVSWRLWTGALGGPLHEAPQGATASQPHCTGVKLTGFAGSLWLACAILEGRSQTAEGDVVELWHSSDRGSSWGRAARLSHTSLKALTLAAGAQNRLLVSGVCADFKAGCAASGIRYLTAPVSGVAQAKHSAVPSLAGTADEIVFAPDGRTAYAFGRSTKNDQLAMFVSHDAGATFTPKSINGVPVRRDASLGITAVSASSDETVSVAFSSVPSTSARLLWLDAEGRVLAWAATPKERTTLGIHGGKAIAIDRDGSGVWESRNGGASWVARSELPGAVCVPSARSNECPVEVVCAEAGCVFAESLTRVGWDDADPEPKADSDALQSPAQRVGDSPEPRQAPIACRMTDPEWQRLAVGASPPTADQAALGGFSWFVVADDPATTEVALWRAARVQGGEQGAAVERRPLLAPVSEPTRFAYLASLQVEGAAVIRYRVPNRVGAAIGPVEVAWEDLVHGSSHRFALPEAGAYRSDDSTKTSDPADRALPALLSITDGGLYLQIHGESSRDQATLFLDGRSANPLPELSWPAALAGARGEYLHVGQTHQPILFLGSTAVVRAEREGSGWQFAAHSVGWADPDRFGIEQELALGYWRGRPALHVAWLDADAPSGTAMVLPFQERGALFAEPIAVPTQADLAQAPEPCAAASLDGTPRVVAKPQWGTRHVINVADSAGMITLLTDAAVLHGTRQQPCVAAFEATLLKAHADEVLSGIIELDAPERAWLFRQSRDAALEYRRMTCNVDAGPAVP
jgi:hypothetical protein